MKIAVMVSGRGSNLQALIDAEKSDVLGGRIARVISSSKDAYALERAAQNGIMTAFVERKAFACREDYDAAVLREMNESGADLFVLAGYMQILSAAAVLKYRNRIINVHPSLIPSFCGLGYFGAKVHQSVIDYGCKVSGATVHFVDEGADTGPIIVQRAVEVLDSDDAAALGQRVLRVEHEILPLAVSLIAAGRVCVDGRRVVIRGENPR